MKKELKCQQVKQESILEEAQRIINSDREETYGDPGRNIRMIAAMWSAYTEIPLTEYDVCNMMELLKVARRRHNPSHRDSLVDSVGYVALQERISDAQGEEK